ncbi:hypothetical protein A6V36_14850 [Paraburkholderia ginsengiterrae]|uniref:Efflux transporter periplasmic adaptor subunit n=1 Tax=Paraburkholderia ginsengiterrae TaxID=1462993 RepID=A0ABX2UJK1_9BURK|nr:efflux RND transporter periplasmic adaptor subunit [Paraburkholderia ginsengiterrae]OAJ51847.1 hypothetical protein A6V36_14850 [Paraburkholderia ginsengiterrae]
MSQAIEEVCVERLSRRRWRVVFGVASVAALALGWGLRITPRHAQPALPAPVPISAGHAIVTDFPVYVAAVGTVTPLNVTDVKVRVDGSLQRIAFTEGEDVKAGQVLAELDRGVLSAQRDQARAALSKDRASLENARFDLERYRKLGPIGAATAQSIDTAKARVDELQATVAADAAQVRNGRLQVGFTTLVAPFDGRAGAKEADVGAILHPGDAKGIVTVTQMEPIDVQFSVPQDVLPELLASRQAGALPVEVFAHAGGAPLSRGTLAFVDSHVDPATGEVMVKASFRNADRRLWPGQFVDARVRLRTDAGRVAVPSRAIVHTQDGSQVYVVDAHGNAGLRPVETGASADGMTEVKRGVARGDVVVFDGQSRLNPGVPVAPTIVDAKAAARAGAAADTDMPS